VTDAPKPIVDIQAVTYSWAEVVQDDDVHIPQTVQHQRCGIQIKREGDENWTNIPVVQGVGP
jgi:hypothetical protein